MTEIWLQRYTIDIILNVMPISTQANFAPHKHNVVLLIEEDEHSSSANARMLEQYGFGVLRARDGELGVELAELYHDTIGLVLLDVLLPRKDGFEVLEELREKKNFKHIPVFMCTNLDDAEDKARATQLGAAEYLIKSQTTPAEVLRKVAERMKE